MTGPCRKPPENPDAQKTLQGTVSGGALESGQGSDGERTQAWRRGAWSYRGKAESEEKYLSDQWGGRSSAWARGRVSVRALGARGGGTSTKPRGRRIC